MKNTVRVSMSDVISGYVKERAENIGVSTSEYFRMLVALDIATYTYQKMSVYINLLYNKINEYHKTLDIHCTPLQDIPTIDLDNLENID